MTSVGPFCWSLLWLAASIQQDIEPPPQPARSRTTSVAECAPGEALTPASIQQKFAKPTPRMEAIAKLFHAELKLWPTEERLRLVYFFRGVADAALSDFTPELKRLKGRARLPNPGDRRSSGLVIAERGLLLHGAKWRDAVVDVRFTPKSGSREGDVVAAVWTADDGRNALGCNLGQTLVRFKRGRWAGKPVPLLFPLTYRDSQVQLGFSVRENVLTCRKDAHAVFVEKGKKLTSALRPKWFAKDESGRVGIVWQGRIQGFVDQITIEGTLDPAWLAKKLPGKPPEGAEGGEGASGKSGRP